MTLEKYPIDVFDLIDKRLYVLQQISYLSRKLLVFLFFECQKLHET